MASEAAWHLRVLAETMDREELICNLVTVQMGRDALREEVKKLKEENKELQDTILARDEELGDIQENVFPGYDEDIHKLKKDNHQLGEAVDALLVGQETLKKENEKLRSPSSTGALEHRIQELEEENEEFRTVEKIIGENWGSLFKEAFEMIGVEEDLIECGFSTPEDFE
jgi:chromosome segregation ATPase